MCVSRSIHLPFTHKKVVNGKSHICNNFVFFKEGNLPSNSKCIKCRKACWSAECLTGMRCQWCGMTVTKTIHLKTSSDHSFDSALTSYILLFSKTNKLGKTLFLNYTVLLPRYFFNGIYRHFKRGFSKCKVFN